jgi:hypothetical protein
MGCMENLIVELAKNGSRQLFAKLHTPLIE